MCWNKACPGHRLFEGRGLLALATAHDMREWAHEGGFSVDASVRIAPEGRATDTQKIKALRRIAGYN